MNKKALIGVDLGGTKVCVAIADYSGNILAQRKFPTQSSAGREAVLESIYQGIEEVHQQAAISWDQIDEIGLSCPGPVDTEKGILYSPPNLPGWEEVPVKIIFQEKYKKTVFVENDANAAALAEMYFGAGHGYKDQVYLTMSTGIGGGVIVDGKLVKGAHYSAGEVGHNVLVPDGPLCGCGRRGCFETLCSGTAIARRMREIAAEAMDVIWWQKAGGNPDNLKPPILLEAARKNDPLSLELLDEIGHYLGLGCAHIVNFLDPEIIILGTLVIHFGELLLAPARKSFLKYVLFPTENPTPLIPAKLKENLAEAAAVSVVLQHHRLA
jgi:glucokinase